MVSAYIVLRHTGGTSLMLNIEFTVTDQMDLDSIRQLWEKLNEHHRLRSLHHAHHFFSTTFDSRKSSLLDKAQKGVLRLDLAKDATTGEICGYCISTVNKEGQGEIESIFVEPEYRRHHIVDHFMKEALHWMDENSVVRRVIGVAAGNEEVFGFYSRFGFYPGVTILRESQY